MERLCDELLARSGGPFDKDVCVCLRRLPDEAVYLLHRRRLAGESLDAALLVDFLLELRYLARKGVLLECLVYALLHLGEVGDRLREEIVGAFLHRLYGELDFAERRDEDACERGVLGLRALYEGDPVLAGHLVVGEEKREVGVLLDQLHRKLGVRSGEAVAAGREYPRHRVARRLLVVHYKYLGFRHLILSGRVFCVRCAAGVS